MEEKKINLPAAITVSAIVTIALIVVSLVQDDSSLESLKMSSIKKSRPGQYLGNLVPALCRGDAFNAKALQ
jgi:hypothetical protein